MGLTVWAIDSPKVNSHREAIGSFMGEEITFIETSSDKLELIEYVDQHIDLILIEGNDSDELYQLIYFFREFNQLLEFVPIILITELSTYQSLLLRPKVGILDFILPSADGGVLCQRIWVSSAVVKNTAELRNENYDYRTRLRDNYRQLEYEKQRSEQLLRNVLPEETSRELMIHGFARPQSYRRVSVLFTDFKGFTKTCEKMTPEQIIRELDAYFTKFDEIIGRHFGEKIKTIGDAYMCAGGIPLRNNSNPIDMVLTGLEMQQFMRESNVAKEQKGLEPWHLRVGIHTGRLITGVIGKKKFAYDIWGDAVNTASRMESSGEPEKVNISGTTYQYIKDWFDCTYRGKIAAKNKGEIDMYFVDGLRPEFSVDGKGFIPNETFLVELSTL